MSPTTASDQRASATHATAGVASTATASSSTTSTSPTSVATGISGPAADGAEGAAGAAATPAVTEVLPGGWHALAVPGVEQPILIGPGGLFVLEVRHHTTLSIGIPHPGAERPWAHDHRNQMSTPQITAELASQLINWACGTHLVCIPVIVVTGDGADAAPRPDGVDVVHEHLLMRWLAHLPAELDHESIDLVVEHLTATHLLPV